MYLVDTNVLSVGAPIKSVATTDLVAWMDRNSGSLFISVVTVAEIEDGIAKNLREGAHRKAGRLSEWLETILHLYSARVMPIDTAIARRIGALSDRARGQGQMPGFADLGIAATAQHHGWTVLTRNVKHFAPTGVPVHNPFEALPRTF